MTPLILRASLSENHIPWEAGETKVKQVKNSTCEFLLLKWICLINSIQFTQLRISEATNQTAFNIGFLRSFIKSNCYNKGDNLAF